MAINVDAQELASLCQLERNLVAWQPTGDRLSGQSLSRRVSDEPTGQRGNQNGANDPGRDNLRPARSASGDLLAAATLPTAIVPCLDRP